MNKNNKNKIEVDSRGINRDFLEKRKMSLFFTIFAFVFAGLASQGVVFFLGFLGDIFRFSLSVFLWFIFYFFLVYIFSRMK